MDFPDYLHQLYDYHYWANHRLLEAAAQLTDEQLHRDQGHSWGSVYGIVLHMLNAEWIWLRRWQGESPPTVHPREDLPTLAALRAYWATHETDMRAFVAAQTSASLAREVVYTNTQGKIYRLVLWQMMAHVPNHGSHHRGELAAIFALMDAPHPEDEWSYYFLEKSGQR
jgi:uncharacterized damage-inducible protein DinB